MLQYHCKYIHFRLNNQKKTQKKNYKPATFSLIWIDYARQVWHLCIGLAHASML